MRPPRNGVKRVKRGSYGGSNDTWSEEWKTITKRIRARDGDRCVKCGRHKKLLNAEGIQLQVNHIVPKCRGGTDADTNLQCECETCHSRNYHHDSMFRKIGLKKARTKARTAAFYKIKGKLL